MGNTSFLGVCPFWKCEHVSRKTMNCELCKFKFPDEQSRREIAYKYCAGDYKECTIYPVAYRAALRADEEQKPQ